MRSHSLAGLALATILFTTAGVAEAHVSISSGPAFATKNSKITFGVGHGCDEHDTIEIRIAIPAGISSVRPLYSDFGKPAVIRDVDGNVTQVSWRKDLADLHPEDLGYYELTLRARVADVPFSTILFSVTQICRDDQGVADTAPVLWDQLPGAGGNTAASLLVLPVRVPGWSSYTLGASTTVPEASMGATFADAQIVWRGTSAFSANPAIATLIGMTPGVTMLTTGLAANDQIWVKY